MDKISKNLRNGPREKKFGNNCYKDHLWEKNRHSIIFSFSESEHLQVPQKKVSVICSWAKVFEPFERGVVSSLALVLGEKWRV